MRSHNLTRASRVAITKSSNVFALRADQINHPPTLSHEQVDDKAGRAPSASHWVPFPVPAARSNPKLTIDSFFSRKVSVRLVSGLDGVAADGEERVLGVALS